MSGPYSVERGVYDNRIVPNGQTTEAVREAEKRAVKGYPDVKGLEARSRLKTDLPVALKLDPQRAEETRDIDSPESTSEEKR